jgi:hypothetical protein
MLRSADLLAPLSGILCHRASTLGSLHQLPVSYEATWLLPRSDSHRLVVPSLARRATYEKGFRPPKQTPGWANFKTAKMGQL